MWVYTTDNIPLSDIASDEIDKFIQSRLRERLFFIYEPIQVYKQTFMLHSFDEGSNDKGRVIHRESDA